MSIPSKDDLQNMIDQYVLTTKTQFPAGTVAVGSAGGGSGVGGAQGGIYPIGPGSAPLQSPWQVPYVAPAPSIPFNWPYPPIAKPEELPEPEPITKAHVIESLDRKSVV